MLLSGAARMAAESEAKFRALLIEKLKYTIAKLRHDKFGQSSERGAILEQLELSLAALEEDASAAETAAQMAAAQAKIEVRSFERRKPARRPLPEHLPRERIVYPAPASCPCCGGVLHKIGEDVTETLQLIPRQWKVIQHVREKFSCRSCESITQPPAPSHPIARGRAGPKLLAHVLFSKYCLHLPLNRQSVVYAREGVDLDISTLADWVGACAATLMPLVEAIRAHVFAAERNDNTVPVLAKGKTRTGRLWTYVATTGRSPAQVRRPRRSSIRPTAAASIEEPSGELRGPDAGGRLCQVQSALRSVPQGRAHCQGGVLGACAAQVFSTWHGCRRRQSQSRRSNASMLCSPSSARSTA
jgi:transposase